jgi:hypothetical protein
VTYLGGALLALLALSELPLLALECLIPCGLVELVGRRRGRRRRLSPVALARPALERERSLLLALGHGPLVLQRRRLLARSPPTHDPPHDERARHALALEPRLTQGGRLLLRGVMREDGGERASRAAGATYRLSCEAERQATKGEGDA